MIIQQKTGNINNHPCCKVIEWVNLEWYETGRRILHKITSAGRQVSMKFLNENQRLAEGDILYEDSDTVIVVSILPCKAIIIHPRSLAETAVICYEIGNRHLPLFIDEDELLIAFDAPVYRYLSSAKYDLIVEDRKLLYPLNTSVKAHVESKDAVKMILKTPIAK